jgi:catalase
MRTAYVAHRDDDDFGQPGTMYREVLDEGQQERLAGNIVGHLSKGVEADVLARAVDYWRKVDPDLGARVAKGTGNGAPW